MRGAVLRSWLEAIARELGRIPDYNREAERLLRAMRNGNRSARRETSNVSEIGLSRNRKRSKRAVALGAWLLAVSLLVLVAADAQAAVPGRVVRTLAEDVLGAGSVTSVRVSNDGAQVLMRWESPTYAQSGGVGATRERIFAEAQLTTGSVMGQLQEINRIRFTIVRKNEMLATGENVRGRGVVVVFSPRMGGGIMKPTTRPYDPNRPQGGEASKEL